MLSSKIGRMELGSVKLNKSTCRRAIKYGSVFTFLILCVRFTWRPPCLLGVIPLRNWPRFDGDARIPADITVVTAFFDIGKFDKGDLGDVFGPNLYFKWASVYAYLQNPLIVYSDSDQFVQFFTQLRKHRLNSTKIIKIERKGLWAFDYLERIRTIFSDPDYPKFPPNTVVPEYSCVQSAKYSCLEKAIQQDYFNTKYFMWVDVGYFRMLTRDRDFRLVVPSDFNESKVALNQVDLSYTMNETPEEIFKRNYVWVGGGLSLATKSVFRKFIADYRKALERYLELGLSSTDQQILFAMSTVDERRILQPSVDVQLYVWNVWGSCWYFLGYQCYKEI